VITTIIAALGVAYVSALVLYFFFLAYCTLRVMRETGRLAAMPVVPRVHCYVLLFVAFGLDVLFNLVVGTLLFLELPRHWTFTARCKNHLSDIGWRGRLARWICNGWLNPGEPGHC
jgi:hypothetical protein